MRYHSDDEAEREEAGREFVDKYSGPIATIAQREAGKLHNPAQSAEDLEQIGYEYAIGRLEDYYKKTQQSTELPEHRLYDHVFSYMALAMRQEAQREEYGVRPSDNMIKARNAVDSLNELTSQDLTEQEVSEATGLPFGPYKQGAERGFTTGTLDLLDRMTKHMESLEGDDDYPYGGEYNDSNLRMVGEDPADRSEYESDETDRKIDAEDEAYTLEDSLPERDFRVLWARTEGKTLDEIGKEFGVTKERIRQIEAKASALARCALANRH